VCEKSSSVQRSELTSAFVCSTPSPALFPRGARLRLPGAALFTSSEAYRWVGGLLLTRSASVGLLDNLQGTFVYPSRPLLAPFDHLSR
jgi:hypothetical protein